MIVCRLFDTATLELRMLGLRSGVWRRSRSFLQGLKPNLVCVCAWRLKPPPPKEKGKGARDGPRPLHRPTLEKQRRPAEAGRYVLTCSKRSRRARAAVPLRVGRAGWRGGWGGSFCDIGGGRGVVLVGGGGAQCRRD